MSNIIFKTMRAAAKAGGYAVRLFSHKKQIGVLGGIDSRDQAIDFQAHADYFGADEAQLVSNHKRGTTLSPTSMRRG